MYVIDHHKPNRMRKFYITALISFCCYTGQAQVNGLTPQPNIDSVLSSRIKQLFNYLLASSRLGIRAQDNITVREIVIDAIRAGYTIDTASCPELRNNMSNPFFTLTPECVRVPGMIIAPGDSCYIAMAGNLKLTFSSVTRFENRLESFYHKPYKTPDTIEYSFIQAPAHYSKYRIRHYADADSMDWYVNYTDVNGMNRHSWLKARDTVFEVLATTVNLVQDIDTVAHIYSASWIDLDTITDPAYVVDQDTYFRPTVARLRIEYDARRATQGNDMFVRTIQNPSYNYFTLAISTGKPGPVNVRLLDAHGRIAETLTTGPETSVQVGRKLSPGVYYAEVLSGGKRQTVKLLRL
jgi:hypothetical protein